MKYRIARPSRILVLALLLSLSFAGYHGFKELPNGVSYAGEPVFTDEITFISDTTWVDMNGQRRVDQTIFDEVFNIIAAAEQLIVLDMFLYNDFQGPVPETTRALADELTSALIAKKMAQPDINIVVITDPVNILYGGLPSPYFDRLRAHQIRVVITDLRQLRDSNIVYSTFWRTFIKPFGNNTATTLANPIGPGRVSLRSYLELINFKANHRKVLIADHGNDYVGLVSSANAHDGSSAHRNAAIRFSGAAVADLLTTENAVLALSGEPSIKFALTTSGAQSNKPSTTIQVVTESKIKQAVLSQLNNATAGDKIDLMMFYLSSREIITALKQAHVRGADLRILLDPNKDAFGRHKNGIPNRPVARELVDANINVRWCRTMGEQCHTKMLLVYGLDRNAVIITGSANFTRRNLNDFNLETNVVVKGPSDEGPFADTITFFDDQWSNTSDRQYSIDYDFYKDESYWHRWLYRFMEWSGFATF